MSTYRLRNDLDNLTYDLEHLVLGSWGQHLHLGRVCPLEGLCAECWAREREAGRLHWLRACLRGRGHAPWFPWESAFGEGPFPEVGGYGQEGQLGPWESPNYLVLFLPWRTNARFCLLFLLCLKAVRCKGGRFFSLDQESSLSATLVNDLVSCQPWV